jgi:hypothetical protein
VVHSCDTETAVCRNTPRVFALAMAGALMACAPEAAPPKRLSGEWGRSPAACAAGFTVRFAPEAVMFGAGEVHRPLLDRPRYADLPDGGVQIEYRLASRPGGVEAALGRGVVTLAPSPEGGLRFASHFYRDGLTGAARMGLAEDQSALARILTVQRCSGPQLGDAIRGRG